jgi:TrmH family RNA methyltransferase
MVNGWIIAEFHLVITSTTNNRVKKIKKQLKEGWPDSQGRILIEGPKLIAEAFKSNLSIDSIFVKQNKRELDHLAELFTGWKANRPEVIELAENVYNSISSTETPQSVLALVHMPKWRMEKILKKESLIVVAIQLQDPGNLGTLIRSSEAFGAAAVILSKYSVNPYNMKAIRASAGSVFRVPSFSGFDSLETVKLLRSHEYRLLATSPERGREFRDFDFRGRVALILGNEARGLDSTLLNVVDGLVTIPIAAAVESLNVSIASSIILCHAAEQRRAFPGS